MGDNDAENHFDLALAYVEMGLTEDALAELAKAMRTSGGQPKAIAALHLFQHLRQRLRQPADPDARPS
jgi:Flp pilus assembly protein TadD